MTWNTFWFQESDGKTEGMFRIGYATVLLLDVLTLWNKLELLYATTGLYGMDRFSMFYQLPVVQTLYVLWICVLVLLLIGWKAVYMSWMNVLLMFYFFTMRGAAHAHAIESIAIAMGAYLFFMHSDRRYSLFPSPDTQPLSIWPVRLAQVHIALVYFLAGLAKLGDIAWIQGTFIHDTFSNTTIVYGAIAQMLQPFSSVLIVITLLTIFMQLSAPIGFFLSATRRWYVWFFVALHIGIGFTLRVGWFSEMMIVCLLLFVSHHRENIAVVSRVVRGFIVIHMSLLLLFTLDVLRFGQGSLRIYNPSMIHSARNVYTMMFFGLRSFDIFPPELLFHNATLLTEAEYDDGTTAPLSPFTDAYQFEPGLSYIKETRLGLVALRQRALTTPAQWSAFTQYMLQTTDRCPKHLRVSAVRLHPSSTEIHTKMLRAESTVDCTEQPTVQHTTVY